MASIAARSLTNWSGGSTSKHVPAWCLDHTINVNSIDPSDSSGLHRNGIGTRRLVSALWRYNPLYVFWLTTASGILSLHFHNSGIILPQSSNTRHSLPFLPTRQHVFYTTY